MMVWKLINKTIFCRNLSRSHIHTIDNEAFANLTNLKRL